MSIHSLGWDKFLDFSYRLHLSFHQHNSFDASFLIVLIRWPWPRRWGEVSCCCNGLVRDSELSFFSSSDPSVRLSESTPKSWRRHRTATAAPNTSAHRFQSNTYNPRTKFSLTADSFNDTMLTLSRNGMHDDAMGPESNKDLGAVDPFTLVVAESVDTGFVSIACFTHSAAVKQYGSNEPLLLTCVSKQSLRGDADATV